MVIIANFSCKIHIDFEDKRTRNLNSINDNITQTWTTYLYASLFAYKPKEIQRMEKKMLTVPSITVVFVKSLTMS